MTDKQIEKLQDSLRGKMFKDMTKEEYTLYHELSWRSYINSCLTYGQEYLIVDENGNLAVKKTNYWGGMSQYELYIKPIGEERAMELYREQKDTFARAKVIKNVYTDSEGVSYNSVKWTDD